MTATTSRCSLPMMNDDPGMAYGETVLRQTDLTRTLRAIANRLTSTAKPYTLCLVPLRTGTIQPAAGREGA